MKRFALTLAAVAVVAGAQSAAAGTAKEQRLERQVTTQRAQIASLRAQVKDLGATVKALQASVKTLQSSVKTLQAAAKKMVDETTANYIGDGCIAAITADALQGSWVYLDQLFTASGKPAVFGPQTAINDFGACALLQTPSISRAIGAPPTATSFAGVISWLHG